MNHEHQVVLGGSLADVGKDIWTHHRQVPVSRKAALEVSFDANPAGTLDRGYSNSRSVIFRLIFGRNTGGLLGIVDKIRKALETCCRGRKGHRIPIGKNQRLATAI